MITQTRINIGIFLALLLLIAIGIISYSSIESLIESSQWVSHTIEMQNELEQLRSHLATAETNQRGYLITHQNYYIKQYAWNVDATLPQLHEIKKLCTDNPDQEARLDHLEILIKERIWGPDGMQNVLEKKSFREVQQILLGGKGKQLDDEIRTAINQLANEEAGLLQQRSKKALRKANTTPLFVEGGTLLAAIFMLLASVMLNLEFRRRRRVQEKMEKTSKTLNRLIDSSPVGILTLNLENNLELWNPACERIFGWKKEEVIGKPLPFVPEEQKHDSQNIIEKILQAQASKHVEIEAERQTKDGRLIKISISGMPIYDDNGRHSGLMAVLNDVTERARLKEETERARALAEHVAESKGEFLANMSHEIRTPLNGIIGMTDLLMDSNLSEEQKKYAKIVQDSGTNLLALINDILDFSKIEAGRMELEVVNISLINLVEGQAALMATRAREKGISLMAYIEPRLPAVVRGDSGRIGQVLLNLISNAIKFTEQGYVVVRAQLIEEKGQSVVVKFSVQDTGIGMTANTQQKLFQPFMQADGSTARKYGGTGLGLSISKNLVELMGGKIQLESELGKGSVFSFVLKLELAEKVVVSEMESALKFQELNVLVVDDDPPAGMIMGKYLENWGCSVTIVPSAKEALSTLRAAAAAQRPYSLAIVDKRMPGMDGFELAEAIRSDLQISGLPLILATAYDRAEQSQAAKRAGFSAYLPKPIFQSELFNAIVTTLHIEGKRISPPTVDAIEPTGSNSNGKRILVAEDNQVNQLLVLTMLKKMGYSAHAVANGQEAFDAITKAHYDLVLMDCQMPEMDGYEATRAIRRWEEETETHIPIIALTANAMAEDQEKCLAAGMDAYVSKPLKKEKLAEALENWLKEPNKS